MSDVGEVFNSSLTANERVALKNNSRASVRWEIIKATIFGYFVFALLFFAISFSLWKWIGIVDHPQDDRYSFMMFSALLAGLFFLKVYWRDIRFWGSQSQTEDLISLDLKGGVAHVLTADVLRAVEIKEYEDEGTGFFLELSDGRVLCTIGQDLYEYAHDADADLDEGVEDMRSLFPQTRIEYRFAPLSGYRLGIKGVGDVLRPYALASTQRSLFKKDKETGVNFYMGPEDGAFYEGTMEDVLRRFGYELELI